MSLRQSLKEKARLANIGGDMRLGQYYRNIQDRVQRDLAKATNQAKKKAEKGDKTGNWIDALKLISGFTPWGAPVNAALSVVDLIGDVSTGVNIPKIKGAGKYAGTPYEQFFKQNIEALNEQVKGARKGKLGKSLISNLLNIGMQPLFGAPAPEQISGEDLVKRLGTDLKDPGKFEGMDFVKLGSSGVGKQSIFDIIKSKVDTPTWKTIKASFPGLSTAEGLSASPTLQNLFLSGVPLASSLMRGRKTPTSPMAPGIQRPSIRGRIR